MTHLTDEEIDALVADALKAGQPTPSRPWADSNPWQCVDDNGEPRKVDGFDPRTP